MANVRVYLHVCKGYPHLIRLRVAVLQPLISSGCSPTMLALASLASWKYKGRLRSAAQTKRPYTTHTIALLSECFCYHLRRSIILELFTRGCDTGSDARGGPRLTAAERK